MIIPKRFTHKGKVWKVKIKSGLVHPDSCDCEALCDIETRTIFLDPSLKGNKKKEKFLHELFHVVIYEAHINTGVRFSEGLEEVLCDAFADLLSTSFNLKWKRK